MRLFLPIQLLFTFFLSGIYSYTYSQARPFQFDTPDAFKQFFYRGPNRTPLVSAHRGGPVDGFPENCIETFENTLAEIPALIECDVLLSKDSVLVMMHDDLLDRTTNGTGYVADKTLIELKQLHLKDSNGILTPYQIPTFDEVLQWAKNKAVIQADVKKGVPADKIVEAIRERQAQSYALVITYTMEDAVKYYQLDTTLLISVTVRNQYELDLLEKSGIPYRNVVAFTGLTEPAPALYQALQSRGISCILATLGNLDKKAAARKSNVYLKLIQNGADIIATDRPREAYEAIRKTSNK